LSGGGGEKILNLKVLAIKALPHLPEILLILNVVLISVGFYIRYNYYFGDMD
jgi:hypothetical protein